MIHRAWLIVAMCAGVMLGALRTTVLEQPVEAQGGGLQAIHYGGHHCFIVTSQGGVTETHDEVCH